MVRKRELWMPKAADCCGYSCVTPPTKQVLAEYNCKALNNHANNADPKTVTREQKEAVRELARRIMYVPPDRGFQLMLLKHVDSTHFVFDKNYVRPKIQKKVVESVYQIRDDEGFF